MGEEKEERADTTEAKREIPEDLNNNGNKHNSLKTSDPSKSPLEGKALSKVSWKKRVKQCVIL